MTSRPATIGGLIERTTQRLRRAGLEAPRREAARLVGELAGMPGTALLLDSDRVAPPELMHRVATASARRAKGEPAPYITGTMGFRHLNLEVDHRVLIPRPETEQLVELVLAAAPTGRVVDVGTGSGCIALSLAWEGSYHDVVASDQSPAALDVARRNAVRHGLAIRLVEGDLLAPVRGERFDAVVSNPPYIAEAEYRLLDPSVRCWEPRQAMVSGVDGLDAIRGLLETAPSVLVNGGLLALEIESTRAVRTAALARDAGWRDVAVVQDLFGRDRFLTARWGRRA